MPFLIPIIAAPLGLGLLGEALVGIGLSLAFGAASQALAPKPKKPDPVPIDISLDPNHPRQVAVGYAMTPGQLVFHNTYGSKNKYLQMVVYLADNPCSELTTIIADGEERSWNSGTGIVDGYSGKLKVTFFNGSQTVAPTVLSSNSGGRWASTDIGKNGTWVLIELTADPKAFPNGIPRFQFVVKGMPLYDPRKDTTVGGSGAHRWATPSTWEWSDNPALFWLLCRRGYFVNGERIFGARTPASMLSMANVITEANHCDTLMAVAAGGTEKRYRINGTFSTAPGAKESIRSVLTAVAGKEIDSGGTIRLQVGVARATVADLIEEVDMLSGVPTKMSPKRSTNNLINATIGTYTDPLQKYSPVDLPIRASSSDEIDDGGRFEASYDLSMVQSQSQGQRILEIFRLGSRQQLTYSGALRSKWCGIEAGDWVRLSSDRHGWVNKVFEVLDSECGLDYTSAVRLQEISSTVFDPGEELDLTNPSDLGGASPPDSTINITDFLNVNLVTDPPGEQKPGLRIEWTPPDDVTVDDLLIQYRQLSSPDDPMEVIVKDPEQGHYTWAEGVLGGIEYEARVRPILSPDRDTNWTSWIAAGGTSDITIGGLVLDVPDGIISIDKLDAQAAHELALATAVDEGLGSAPNNKSLLEEYLATLGEALGDLTNTIIRHREELIAEANGARSEVVREAILRATETSALAALIETVSTTLNDSVATVQQILTSVDGIRAQAMTKIDINGRVVGFYSLDGTIDSSIFNVVADKFLFSHPDVNGGDPTPIMAIGTVDGNTALVIRGDIIADGGIAAKHLSVVSLDAIAGNFGEITAGVARSPDGKFVLDLNNKRLRAVT